MGEHVTAYLVLAALNMALEQRKTQGCHPPQRTGQPVHMPGLWRAVPQMQVCPSMGTVGDAYDNAMAESFFASLEGELIERNTFQSKAQTRMAEFTWIKGWHNPWHCQSSYFVGTGAILE